MMESLMTSVLFSSGQYWSAFFFWFSSRAVSMTITFTSFSSTSRQKFSKEFVLGAWVAM